MAFYLCGAPDQLWLIYVLTVLQLIFSTFFEPARTAAVPSIVSDRELLPANAISSVTWSAMLTIGAAIGGVVTGLFGTNAAFLLDSLSYLASAAFIASIRFPKRPVREKTKLSVGKALGITQTIEGMRYVKHRPRVLALLLVKPAWGLGGGILTLLAVFGEKIFPVGRSTATGIGVLFAARGIGTAVGPIVARRFAGESRARMLTSIGIAFLIGGVFLYCVRQRRQLLVCAAGAGPGAHGRQYSLGLLDSAVATRRRRSIFVAECSRLSWLC